MKYRITIWDLDSKLRTNASQPQLQELRKAALQIFAPYSPQTADNGESGQYLSVFTDFFAATDDPKVRSLLNELAELARDSKPPARVTFQEEPEKHEMNRVRFLLPYYFCDFVDDSSNCQSLNKGIYLCEDCLYPNLDIFPEPFLVNKKVLKKYDIFDTRVGTLIVRRRVLQLLQEWVGNEILWGKALIAKSKEQPTGDDELYWVRPKVTIGEGLECRRYRISAQKCKTCQRSLEQYEAKSSASGLVDVRSMLHLEVMDCKVGIGWLLWPVSLSKWPYIVMSGNLLAKLKVHNVKGIVASGKQLELRCLFPDNGESPLSEETVQPMVTDSAIPKPDLEPARKVVASLKNIPWDCTKDGYIYFHLTTPEFLVLDPMTWEEDSEGPYIIKKFSGPGLYRLPVTAIKAAKEDKRNVTVDSATLVFIDNAFFDAFGDHYEWDKSTTNKGEVSPKYYQAVAEKIGSRFGVCTTPPKKFKSDFQGDGFYAIDVKKIERVES